MSLTLFTFERPGSTFKVICFENDLPITAVENVNIVPLVNIQAWARNRQCELIFPRSHRCSGCVISRINVVAAFLFESSSTHAAAWRRSRYATIFYLIVAVSIKVSFISQFSPVYMSILISRLLQPRFRNLC